MKKKCFNTLGIVVLSLLFTFGTGAFSALAQTVSFPTNHGVTPGAATIIPVNITGAEGASIGGYGLRIDYDETVLSNPQADLTGTWSEGNADLVEGTATDGVGKYSIAIGFGFSATDDSKPIVNVRFDVAQGFTGDPTSAVSFAGDNETVGSFLMTSGFDLINATWEDGSVGITLPPTITASITEGNGSITYGGTSAIGEKTFTAGDTPAYTITPDSGYKITSVLIDGTTEAKELLVDQNYSFAALADGDTKIIAVSFALIDQPTITATITDTEKHGSITFNDADATGLITHAVGDTPIYKVTPETGYKVVSIMVGGESKTLAADGTYTFVELIEGDELTMDVSFGAIVYPKITATGDDNATITSDSGTETDVPGEMSYAIGAEPKYTVSFSTNYKLKTLTVTLNGNPVADATLDANNAYTFAPLNEGDVHSIAVTSVLDNAVPIPTEGTLNAEVGSITTGQLAGEDTDGTIASFQIVTQPTKGFVDITDAATGAYSYEARSSAVVGDEDTFTFTVTDDKGAVSDPATIQVTLIKINNPPIPDAGLILEASATGATVGQLSATDAEDDPLTYSIVSQPATGGAVTLTDAATGAYTFNPFAGATGTVTFTFQVNDGTSDASAPGTVTVNIGGTAPEVQNDELNVTAGETVTGTLIATGGVPPYEFSIESQPANGAVALTDTASGAYEYTANSDAPETDAFTFKVTDSNGVESNVATITVTVIPAGDIVVTAMVANGGSITPEEETVAEGGEVTFTITIEEGWIMGTVMDNGVDVTSELTEENTYTLTDITEAHNIIVTLIPDVPYSSADYGAGDPEHANDFKISLSELLRPVQFYTIGAYHCDPNGEDGYAAGDGDQDSCEPNTSDYNTQDWKINLSELLRVVQFYVLGGYHLVPDGEVDLEGDGFIAGYEIVIE